MGMHNFKQMIMLVLRPWVTGIIYTNGELVVSKLKNS